MSDWQKLKTLAKLGAIYGIIGAMFYIGVVYIWAFLNSSPGGLAQYSEPMRYVTLSGLILFSPLLIFPTAVLSFFGPAVSTDARNLVMIIALPLMGALIGTVLDYAAGWLEKSGAIRMIVPVKKG